MKKIIFSGVQPSGNLHIGNYLGAIKNWVKLQDEHECVFCIVDLHAITVPQNPANLQKQILEIAKIYLAAGINPEKSVIFIQSHIPEHTELAWILNTIAKVSELERMTQFKDKSENKEGVSMGLFDYPILMAADILLYNTALVPVGEDQLQHIELTRTLAKRFNAKFGETFIIPEAYVTKESMRIMGLDDPSKKMSKSAASDYNYIALTDSETAVQKKIKKAVTDSGSEIIYTDDKPALQNLINIYSLFSNESPKDIEKKYAGKGYVEFKNDLAEVINSFLKPLQEKVTKLSDQEAVAILKAGVEKAQHLAQNKMVEVKQRVGLG